MISWKTLFLAFICFTFYVLAYVTLDQVLANLGHLCFVVTFALAIDDAVRIWRG